MKRLHVHVSVSDLDASVRFYSSLFAAEPVVLKPDCAKWMPDDPLEEGETVCCYPKSEKSWIEDPQGIRWETFLTTGESTVHGNEAIEPSEACCAPTRTFRASTGACCTAQDRSRAKTLGSACCA